jgi:hypothetical protein
MSLWAVASAGCKAEVNESNGSVESKGLPRLALTSTNLKVEISNLNYLISVRDSAKSGMGLRIIAT